MIAAKSRSLAVALALLLLIPMFASIPVAVGQPPVPQAGTQLHGFKLIGSAPPNLPILVTLALPLRNTAALDSLVMQVSDPSSPMFRHFLTPQQVREEFLPTAAFESLLAYLKASGLQVQMTALDSEIVVEGTVSQFQSALGTTINTYTNGTSSYYASAGSSTFDGAYIYASNATFLFMKPTVLSPAHPNSNVTFTSGSFSAKQLQPVYNATYFYSRGYDGSGQTIGLLDFYGSPTIVSDLSLFDSTFGFPDANLSIIPVGPYDPNLGANVGWSTEVSLDVEVSHAMAPGAAIDLYVANGALPMSVPLAKIVEDDKVTTLSQSFGTPEWYYSLSSYLGGPLFVAFNALIPDQYYALGSVEGISFLASSGDAGGGGYSSGPEGGLEYPSSSPFVTSVGGTQTYFSASPTGGQAFLQTGWSNIGFVPNAANQGGGGGGVSILEPKPWYQASQPTPPSFPNGRLNPDLSLQAGVDPATEIVDSGRVVGAGGTSESSPLLAGLLTLVAQSLNGQLGLINPFVYKVGNNAAELQKAFNPVTFGYIIPWRAAPGYDFATGWGAPNMGMLATLLNSTLPVRQLSVQGEIFNKTGLGRADFTPGQLTNVSARITDAGVGVTTGSFAVSLQTLAGTSSPTPMTYDPATGNWTVAIPIGQESGITYVLLSGSSGGVSGEAMGVVFTGYVGSLTVTGSIYSLPLDPWTWSPSSTLGLTVFTTDLLGNPEPAGPVPLSVQSYSILTNRYTNSSSVTLSGTGAGLVDGYLSAPAPDGPVSLVLEGGTYGYAPTVYGIYLQSSYVYPAVAAEPGSVAPGQYLTIIANPIAPVNVYFETSFETGRQFAYDVFVGSNVTAELLNPSGTAVSTANLVYQPCAQALRVCNGGANVIYGQLLVPTGSTSGLYTVMLRASYRSYTPGGNISGSFYGQVWVSGPMISPSVSVEPGLGRVLSIPPPPISGSTPSGLYESEQAQVVAKIAYSNSTAVKFGEFTALIYPQSLQGQYASLMHSEYAGDQLIQLRYDPAFQDWVGNVTLPGPSGQGGAAGLGVTPLIPSGPWEVYVTGITADGVPTTSVLSAQQPFTIQPYDFVTGPVTSLTHGSPYAYSTATISGSGALSGDVFLLNNEIRGATITITDSQIQGTLVLTGSNVTLVGVSGGLIVVTGSTLTLVDSTVDGLSISGGHVTLKDSSYGQVQPALPTIEVSGLSKPIGGISAYNITASGSGLGTGSLAAWVDGSAADLKVNSTSEGIFAVGRIDATSLSDGVHVFTVVATQSDGLSSTLSTSFSTDAHQLALENQTSALFDAVIVLAAVAAVALMVSILALRGKRAATPFPASHPPQV